MAEYWINTFIGTFTSEKVTKSGYGEHIFSSYERFKDMVITGKPAHLIGLAHFSGILESRFFYKMYV